MLNPDGSLQHSCRRFPTIAAALFRHTVLGALFPRTIALIAAGAISNERLVTHVSSFTHAEEAYAAGLDRKGGYIKGVIEFD